MFRLFPSPSTSSSTARPRLALVAAFVAALGVGTAPSTAAQGLPTLTPADYGQWQSLGTPVLDPTGRWVAIPIRTVDGDVELRVHAADGSGSSRVLERGSRPEFTPDGARMLWLQGADDDADEGTPESHDRLGVVDLSAGVDSVAFATRSFSLSGDGRWVAALGTAVADTVGADLTLLELATGRHTTLGNVDGYTWRDTGALIALTLRTASGTGNGVALFDPASGAIRSLDAANTRYRSPTWREDAGDLAVLRATEADGRLDEGHDVLLWQGLDGGLPASVPAPRILAAVGRGDLADSLRIPETAGIDWSDDGRVVFMGLRPWEADPDAEQEESTEDAGGGVDGELGSGGAGGESGSDGESGGADVDEVDPSPVQVWHWNDDRILRAQESSEGFDQRRSMLAAWHLDADRLVPLGSELDEPVRLSADGRWGLVADVDPYEFERRFGASTQDVYRIDVGSGERTLLAEGVSSFPVLGPAGERVLVYNDDAWTAVELATLRRTALGAGVDVTFTQPLDDFDYPGVRPSYGVGGWASDESVAWLHDRYDVWEADLASGSLVRRTTGMDDGLEYRVLNLDPEASTFDPSAAGLDPDQPMWLRLTDPSTMASGYGRSTGPGEVERLVFDDAAVARLIKADEAERYILTKETFDSPPTVFSAGRNLADLTPIHATNPFQADFAWGRNEMLSYTTAAGHDLHAILTYPADYDPDRTYPLILYQYERLSQGLHRYVPPSRTSYYNVQVWSQAGYFVLQPDIVYEPGRPGPSAVDAIEHALDAALAAAPVDPDRMGLIGHSWGGYQAAYVPTRMHRFAASVAGAAITNFLSFPGTVHWNGGLPELGHWETGQARMALPPWEDMAGHIESSPVAAIDQLETPMLLMHGDADGVVDFRQGLEFYNYARRLGKEVVMLVYPGADHGLRREENQVDYQTRILEWFDHYLKGDPAAAWITQGEDWTTRSKRIGGDP